MPPLRTTALLTVLALLGTFATACEATPEHPGGAALSEADALDIATDACVYGYPLVTTEYTRRAITNTVAPQSTTAPMGQLVRTRE